MKKVLNVRVINLLLCFSSVLMMSCVTVRNVGPYSTSNSDLSLRVEGVVQKSSPYLWCIYVPFTYISNKGIVVQIENTGSNPITIDWNKSSITYGNKVSNVFLSEQKFSTARTANVPPLTIPSRVSHSAEVYPANKVYWDEEWEIDGMGLNSGEEIILCLSASVEGKEGVVTIKFPIDVNDGFHFGFIEPF